MENNSIKFDKDTPAIVAANKVQSLMAVNKDTGEVGNVEFPLLVQEAGKHVADAVKVTGDVLPTLGDANKRYSFTTGSAGRTLTWTNPVNSQVSTFTFGANKQCSVFWDGVAKVWSKEDEVGLPKGADGRTLLTEGISGTIIKFENVTTKGYYNLSGVFNTASQTYITSFNACEEGDVIEAQTRTLSDSYAIIIFDENQNFVRGVAGTGTGTPTLIKRTTTIQAGEAYWRVANTAQSEAQKYDAYAKVLIGGEASAEEVTRASNEINENTPRTNVVTTEAAVVNLLDKYSLSKINVLLTPFLTLETDSVLLNLTSNIVSGGIDGSGNSNTNAQRIRTNIFLEYPSLRVVNSNLGDYVVYFYAFSGVFLGETGWITSVGDRTHSFSGAAKTKMIFRNKASSNITPADFAALNIQVYSVSTQPEELATKKDVTKGDPKAVPFNINTKAKVISNWVVEKMCHDGNLQVDNNGNFYLPYYASNDSYTETPSASGVSSRMSYWNICDVNNITYKEMMKKNETVGTETFSNSNAPYVPSVFPYLSNNNHLLYLVSAQIQGDSQGWSWVGRTWDKTTENWLVGSVLQRAKITYQHEGVTKTVNFSERGIEQLVADKEGRTISNPGFQMVMTRWKKYDNEYYTFFGTGTWSSLTNGHIVKTTDGINYTWVGMPPSERTNIWEGAIEIVGDELFCVVRGRGYMWVLNLLTNVWETVPNVMTNIVEQRMAMHKKDGFIYLFYNITNVAQSGWVAIRNNVRIAKIDPASRQVVDTQEFASPHGFHYYGFVEWYNQTYCYFTEDRRHLNSADPKTNISIMPWEELVKV